MKEHFVIDSTSTLEVGTAMPASTPVQSQSKVEDYFSQLMKAGEHVISFADCELLARELGVNSSVLNTCNGDWRIILFAASPMDPDVEKRLRGRADVHTIRNILEGDEKITNARISQAISQEIFVDKEMWTSMMREDPISCRIGWQLNQNQKLSLNKILRIIDLRKINHSQILS